MSELARDESIEGELLTGQCSLAYTRFCTNTNVQLVEDPYEADVNDTPGQLIEACPECLEQLALDI